MNGGLDLFLVDKTNPDRKFMIFKISLLVSFHL